MERPDEDFRAAVLEGIAGDRWIVDGNYSRVRDMVWARATGIVWLNYPFPLVFARAFGRTLRRAVRRERLYSDNRESFRRAFFTRESILWWVISSHQRRRRQYRELIDRGTFGHLCVHEFARPREAEAFLSSIEALR